MPTNLNNYNLFFCHNLVHFLQSVPGGNCIAHLLIRFHSQMPLEFFTFSLSLLKLFLLQKLRRPTDMDSITPQALQKMCENILFLLTTTVDVMEPVSK